MKHILAVLFLFVATMLSAQTQNHDLIITNSSERIDAVIIEVTSTEIKYKQADFQTGPTFVLAKSEIASIIYSNGQVQTFQQQAAQSVQQQQPQYQQPVYQGNPYYGAQNTMQPRGQMGHLTCVGNDIYLDGRPLTAYQYAELLRRNCPPAYNEYRSGLIMQYCGWSFLGAGIPLMAIGLWMAIDWDDYFWCMAATGMAFTTVAVPLLAVGYPRAKKSHQTYNQYSMGYPITLNMQASKNGVGLALNF